jgi:hypothetical protein
MHPGKLVHKSVPVTAGSRAIMVGFTRFADDGSTAEGAAGGAGRACAAGGDVKSDGTCTMQ